MLTGLFQTTALLLTPLLFYALDFALIARYDQRRKNTKSGRSWDFTLLMFAAVAVVALQPVFLPQLGLRITGAFGLFLQDIGIALILTGLGLHMWSRVHLQHYYAERVEILEGHQVICSGPYALMRHPVFTSFFAMVTGLMLVNPALTTLALAGYTFWDFTRAARQEEDLLSQNLPGYRDYMRQTPPFLPKPAALWKGSR